MLDAGSTPAKILMKAWDIKMIFCQAKENFNHPISLNY